MNHRHLAIVLLLAFSSACATTSTTETTWTQPEWGDWARPGYVESVHEIVRRTEGHPARGALAGALIGGLLFGRHGAVSPFGAVGGAMVGAAASQGSTESRLFQLVVRFDDGGQGVFTYEGYPPFAPGQPVVLTPQGVAGR
jgi:outer membrane lipoprotein SlyB